MATLRRRFKIRITLEEHAILRACKDTEFSHEAFPSAAEMVGYVEGLAEVNEILSPLTAADQEFKTSFGFHHPGHAFKGRKQPLETNEDLGVLNSLHESVSRTSIYLFFKVTKLSPSSSMAPRKRCSAGHPLSASGTGGPSTSTSKIELKAQALSELTHRQDEGGHFSKRYSPEQMQVRQQLIVCELFHCWTWVWIVVRVWLSVGFL